MASEENATSSGEDGQTNVEKHTREVTRARDHLDLAEHVTWLLEQAVNPVDYPQNVTVTIEVDHAD